MINYEQAENILKAKKSNMYKKVEALLNEASKSYYNTDSVIMTDIEYDNLYNLYKSVTGKTLIGAEPNSKKGTINVSHSFKHLVGTLDKARNLDEVEPFLSKYFSVPVKKGLYTFSLTLKYDGNSVTIERDGNGKIIKALTRGRDGKGKDLTDAFRSLGNQIPLSHVSFEYGDDAIYAIKYEVIITYDNYEKVCKWFNTSYSNPRSMVSGILGSDNAGDYVKFLTLIPLEMRVKEPDSDSEDDIVFVDGIKYSFIPEISALHNTKEYADYYTNYRKYYSVRTIQQAWEIIEAYYNYVNDIREDLPFMIDGIVVDFYNEEIIKKYYYDPRGFIPQHSFAIKLPYLEKVGIVTDIDFCVGNLGRVTPRIWFTGEDGKPINFNGTEHSKQQISNYKRFKELNLGKGSKILVSYHNDCLSYITKMDIPENDEITPFEYTDTCPSCGHELTLWVNDDGEETITECENPHCPARKIGKIVNYLTKMDIKGIKENTIETLFNDGIVKDIISLYNLDYKKVSKLLGPKVAENIKEAIESKKYYDYEILGSLSIPKISLESAKIICKKYSLDDLDKMKDISNNIVELEGFSKIKTESFVNGYNENLDTIEFLKERGYMKYKDEFKNVNNEGGLRIVATGWRDDAMKIKLEKMGHKLSYSAPSKKTNLVVYSDNPGATKMNKAKELGIETIHLDEFKNRFGL